MKKSGGNTNRGRSHNRFKHGMSGTPTYKSWSCMKSRCLNVNDTNYKNWGGKGITVCQEWMEFENFLRDMGVKPSGMTLERKDGDKGYNKMNCIWADRTTQSRNRAYVKLSEDSAAEIRRLRKSGQTYMYMANKFGVSQSQIFRVCTNQSWVK